MAANKILVDHSSVPNQILVDYNASGIKHRRKSFTHLLKQSNRVFNPMMEMSRSSEAAAPITRSNRQHGDKKNKHHHHGTERPLIENRRNRNRAPITQINMRRSATVNAYHTNGVSHINELTNVNPTAKQFHYSNNNNPNHPKRYHNSAIVVNTPQVSKTSHFTLRRRKSKSAKKTADIGNTQEHNSFTASVLNGGGSTHLGNTQTTQYSHSMMEMDNHNNKKHRQKGKHKKHRQFHRPPPNDPMLLNGYHTADDALGQHIEDNNSVFSDAESTMTDQDVTFDALRLAVMANNNGYMSDQSHALYAIQNDKKLSKTTHTQRLLHSHPKTQMKSPRLIHSVSNGNSYSYKHSNSVIGNVKPKKKKKRPSPKKSKDKFRPKRHSIGHTDSSTLQELKAKYARDSDLSKIKKNSSVKWGKSVSSKTVRNSTKDTSKKRRRSLFNKEQLPSAIGNEAMTPYEEIDGSKWDIQALMNIVTEQEFHHSLSQHSKEDIVELCWDLLRSKDKSDDILSMVSLMNHDLDQEKAYDTMMSTIKQTLEVKFCSLYAKEEDSKYLKCLWTSSGEPDKDILISTTSSTQIPARVFQKDQAIKLSLTENNEQICPDFDGFGYVYVMGIPIRNYKSERIGVLMAYRDRSQAENFDDRDLHSAQMLTSIAATTLKNVQRYADANEKEKQSVKILSMIDEMSGDVSEGYQQIIKKLVRKIRSLVACTQIDFWIVDFHTNTMKCEVSHNTKLQDQVIERDKSHVLGQVAITGKYVKIDNSRYDSRYSDDQLKYCQGESILVIPVRVESDSFPIAVIQAINKVPKKKHYSSGYSYYSEPKTLRVLPFTNADRRILETFATSSSIIIKNSLLFQKINGLNRKHESMIRILRALQEKHNVTHMLSDATLAVRDALEAERVSMWFEDGQGNLDALDIGDEQLDGDTIGDDDYKSVCSDGGNRIGNINNPAITATFGAIARYCSEERILINTPNVFEDESLWNKLQDYIDYKQISALNENHWFLRRPCSVLSVPILSNNAVVGVIQAIYKQSGEHFTIEDQQIVEAVSFEVAHTIARNISDLCLQKYVERHDDIPLDVIDYYLTGAFDQQGVEENMAGEGDEQMDPEEPYYYNRETNKLAIIESPMITSTFSPQNLSGFGLSADTMTGKLFDDLANEYIPYSLPEHLKRYFVLLPSCDFDSTQFDDKEDLEQFVLMALDASGLIKEFNLNIPKLRLFIHNVGKLYKMNPFHNWQHGFFVFHFVYYFIESTDIRNILSKKDLLAILIAAMCHDVDHPGNDNVYEVNSETDLSRIYNGISVLENHHTYTTLALLRKSELNFFDGSTLTTNEIKEFRSVLIKSIMGTDMTEHHHQAVDWLNDWVKEDVWQTLKDPKLKEQKKRQILVKICQCIVHLGDLSPQTYPWRIAKEWERRIAREFKLQTIQEKNSGIPVRDWMEKTDLGNRYNAQHFFVDYVVKPLWEPTARLFPKIEERLTTLKKNSQKYIEIANKKKAAAQTTK